MSMAYYAVNAYGILLDTDTMNMLSEKIKAPNDARDLCITANIFSLERVARFSGEAIKVLETGEDDYYSETQMFEDTEIFYVPVVYFPSLFPSMYTSMEQIIDACKRNYGGIFPPDFDYRKNISHIVGVNYQ